MLGVPLTLDRAFSARIGPLRRPDGLYLALTGLAPKQQVLITHLDALVGRLDTRCPTGAAARRGESGPKMHFSTRALGECGVVKHVFSPFGGLFGVRGLVIHPFRSTSEFEPCTSCGKVGGLRRPTRYPQLQVTPWYTRTHHTYHTNTTVPSPSVLKS